MQKETQSFRKLDVWSRKARSQTLSIRKGLGLCWEDRAGHLLCYYWGDTHSFQINFKTVFTVSILLLMNNFALFVSQRDT